MAFQPPPEWEQYINGFGSPFQPIDLSVPPTLDQQQFALPGEIAKHGDVNAPLPPPPPPQTIAAPGVPVADEVPQGAVEAPPLTPEEEAQIQIEPQQPELQTPPMLNVDAVSGGYTPEQKLRILGETDARNVTSAEPPPPPDDYLSEEELAQKYSALPVEQREAFRRKVEGPKQEMLAAGKLEADTQRLRDAEDSARIYQDSVRDAQERAKQLDAEARQIADENPLDSISGGRKIMGVLASIVGGFMVNKTGRNMGLEAVDQIANEAAQLHAQKLQLNARQQAGIGDQIARAGDVSKASEAVRLAVYDGAIKQLETKVQDFDPRGTNAVRMMDDIVALKQRRADALAQYLQGEQKRLEEERKYELDAMKAQGQYAKDMADAQKTGLESQKLAGQLGGGGAVKPQKFEDVPRSLAELRALGVAIPDGVAEPQGGISLTQAKKLADSGKSAEEWAKASRENSPEDRARQLSVGEIVDDQGDPVQFRSTEFAGKLAGTKASVDTVAQYADEMIDLYDKHGFESDFLKSDAWRQAQGAFAAALLEAKNGDQLGALSGSDIDLEAKKITGGVDVTGLRDPTSALQSFKRRMGTKLNAMIRAEAVLPKGRHVKPWSPPNTAASTMPTAKGDYIDELGADLTKALYKPQPAETGNPVADTAAKFNNLLYKPLNDDVEKKFDILIANAAIQNDQGERARKYLRGIAEKAVYPEMKAKAQAALDALPGANTRTDEAR